MHSTMQRLFKVLVRIFDVARASKSAVAYSKVPQQAHWYLQLNYQALCLPKLVGGVIQKNKIKKP
jgi:hypothetical protein